MIFRLVAFVARVRAWACPNFRRHYEEGKRRVYRIPYFEITQKDLLVVLQSNLQEEVLEIEGVGDPRLGCRRAMAPTLTWPQPYYCRHRNTANIMDDGLRCMCLKLPKLTLCTGIRTTTNASLT